MISIFLRDDIEMNVRPETEKFKLLFPSWDKQGYLYQKVRHFFESAQSYQNHVFSWFYALLMILFCFFGFRCVLITKLTKILHFRVSVAKIFQFGYFDTILAKKRILAYRGYKGHFLAWIGGQLPPKLRSLNKRLNFP